MPRDPTDNLMLKGLAALAVLAGVVYFYPFGWPAGGYQEQVANVQQAQDALKPILKDYGYHYPEPSSAVQGVFEDESPIVKPTNLTSISSRKREYEQATAKLNAKIADKETATRMGFATWTEVPASEDVPGFYFQRKWADFKDVLLDKGRRANVDVVDQDIGFKKISGDVRMAREKARDYLRELFIAQTVINLCITAKTDQEDFERRSGNRPEAFMRIISVAPEDPVKIGPYSRTLNPKYNPSERNPKSEAYQKYITREWPAFIWMYPVKILLQCDVNSLRNFLKSVRSPRQFLVIRNLEIVSPYLKESHKDQTVLQRLAGSKTLETGYKEEHVWVELSAAGMDFFVPAKGAKPAPAPAGPGAPAPKSPGPGAPPTGPRVPTGA